jgi:hypothetical protein
MNTTNLNLELSSKNVPTVEQFRKNGYKVRVWHERFQYKPWTKLSRPPENYSPWGDLVPQHLLTPANRTQKGGATTIMITTPDGVNHYSARALCSKIDCFDRKKGVKICLGRIVKQIQKAVAYSDVPF